MFEETMSRVLKRKGVWALLSLLLLLQAAAIALVFARENAERRAEQARLTSNRNPDGSWRANASEPIVLPRVAKREEAGINPAEIVIGVDVGGKARAYRLGALESFRSHLVNDVIGTVPVSVAYCNVTDCVTVLTDSGRSGPLDVRVAGLLNLEMVLQINGNLYYQKSSSPVDPATPTPAMPLRVLSSTRTTWREWTSRYPDTDVYVGEPSSSARRPAETGGPAISRPAPKG